MYEPVKFRRLNEIVKELSSKLEKLHDGQLTKSELEFLTEESRELYERLVVLRFKAFHDEVHSEVKEQSPSANEGQPKVEESVVQPISFRIDNIEKNENSAQVSLIDAIEEVVKEIEKQPETDAISTTATEPVITNVQLESSSLNDRMKQATTENFYEKLSKTLEQKESLNHKLEHTSIPDLKRAISLNQRFQFSKELFKGNNQEYEVAIEKLNTTTREDAMKQLENLRMKYQWNSSSSTATDFLDLVERRYL